MKNLTPELQPSIQRLLKGLPAPHQSYIQEQYARILPILLTLLTPHAIWERNRTWPGVSPIGKAATSLLMVRNVSKVRKAVHSYATQLNEDEDQLWDLVFAYCRFGPIGFIDTLDHGLESIIPDEVAEYARFLRLGKHPRADAGIYVRELLNLYVQNLGFAELPSFVARYAFASNRKLTNWFVGNDTPTEHVVRTTRRLNRNLTYPHQRWHVSIKHLDIQCRIAERHPAVINPWLIWLSDHYTSALQSIRLCVSEPQMRDTLIALRWGIWHYNSPWWTSRGIPEIVTIPWSSSIEDSSIRESLIYLHAEIAEQTAEEQAKSKDIPSTIDEWLAQARSQQQHNTSQSDLPTLFQLTQYLLTAIQNSQTNVIASSTPAVLSEQQVTLPWSTGVAAAYLLPSGGQYEVIKGRVSLWGVPYDAADLPEKTVVDIRFDPDDARTCFLVHNSHHVVRATASAFIGAQITWFDLVEDPEQLRRLR